MTKGEKLKFLRQLPKEGKQIYWADKAMLKKLQCINEDTLNKFVEAALALDELFDSQVKYDDMVAYGETLTIPTMAKAFRESIKGSFRCSLLINGNLVSLDLSDGVVFNEITEIVENAKIRAYTAMTEYTHVKDLLDFVNNIE